MSPKAEKTAKKKVVEKTKMVKKNEMDKEAKIPKPDGWLAFDIDFKAKKSEKNPLSRRDISVDEPSFKLKELAHLESKGIYPCPLMLLHDPHGNLVETTGRRKKPWSKFICFPGVVYEEKKPDANNNEKSDGYNQIANATAMAAAMLEILGRKAKSPVTMPVVGFLFFGPKVRVYITSGTDQVNDKKMGKSSRYVSYNISEGPCHASTIY